MHFQSFVKDSGEKKKDPLAKCVIHGRKWLCHEQLVLAGPVRWGEYLHGTFKQDDIRTVTLIEMHMTYGVIFSFLIVLCVCQIHITHDIFGNVL